MDQAACPDRASDDALRLVVGSTRTGDWPVEGRHSRGPSVPGPQRADRIHVSRILRGFETYRDVTLRAEVVYLVRLHLLDDAREVQAIG